MARNCVLIPQIKNKEGNLVESILFKDLSKYIGDRKQSVKLYSAVKNPQFILDWGQSLKYDKNGEPTFRSLYDKLNLKNLVDTDTLLKKLNIEIGVLPLPSKPKYIDDTSTNRDRLINESNLFNSTHLFKDKFVSVLDKIMDPLTNKMKIRRKIVVKSDTNAKEAADMQYNHNLNTLLREILKSKGISVGALTELERRRGINGVTDFSQAKDAAKGIVELIRIAEGERGEAILPEEFAHFVIEAMGDDPLINRLIKTIIQKGLSQEIIGDATYQQYVEEYEGDQEKLAKEAAGKLLAKHLLRLEPIINSPIRSFLNRVIDAVKAFLKSFSPQSIRTAMRDADRLTSNLAKDILTGRSLANLRLTDALSSTQYYNIEEKINRDQKLLMNIREKQLKKLNIFQKRNPKDKLTLEQTLILGDIELNLYNQTYIEGIYNFLENAFTDLKKLDSQIKAIGLDLTVSINERSKSLREVINNLNSYRSILEDILANIREDENLGSDRYSKKFKVIADEAFSVMNNLLIDYDKIGKSMFISFIEPFVGTNIKIPFATYEGKLLTAELMVTTLEKDVTLYSRWLESMAESGDEINRIIDLIVKLAKTKSRLKTIDLQKELEAAGKKLEQAGVKDTDWMFAKDTNGNTTGYYITEHDWAKYYEAKNKFWEGLLKKYGTTPNQAEREAMNLERINWLKDNSIEESPSQRIPNHKYANKDFFNLSEPKKQFYETVMNIKRLLDELLPDKMTKEFRAVQVRKDLVERVKSSQNLGQGAKTIWENIKDGYIERVDDIDFSDVKYVNTDFDGKGIQTLPVYYTKMLENPALISTDVVSTMTAYASMAYDFLEMNNIIHTLEVGRDILRKRKPIKRLGNKKLQEKIQVAGRELVKDVLQDDGRTASEKRRDDFYEMLIYGRYMAEEGTFGNSNLSIAKTANKVNQYTSIMNLSLNALSGVANIAVGLIMMRVEALSKEFFDMRDVIFADKIYAKQIPQVMGEIGSRVKTSKLSLWAETFDALLEYDKDIKNSNFDRKTWFSRMFNVNSLFFMQNAGEHWMQLRTTLALAHTYKMKDSKGKIVNLWDAMEILYIDSKNKKLGAKLVIKEGYTKEDGTKFTTEDIHKFTRKAAAINQRMHGVYNKQDRDAFLKLAVGRLAMMYRKWIIPSINRRYKGAQYNYDLDAWTEGFYRTGWRFLKLLAKDLKHGLLDIMNNFNNMSNMEKANIRRALTEVAHFLILAIALGIIDWKGGDDEDKDKERSWWSYMGEYQLRRLFTEIGVFVPTGVTNLSEGFKILNSPAAGINTLEKFLSTFTLLNPFAYFDIMEGGKYEGRSKAYRAFRNSPFMFIDKTVNRILNPEEVIPYYKQ